MISDKGRRWDIQTSSNEDSINEVAIFSPINKIITSDNFKGGKIVMVFGGGRVDISQVKSTEKMIPLEIVAIFGGGKIIIPKGWKVNSQGTAIFGGYNSKIESGEGENILNINGAAIFGGVEITN
jgi:predicted membrane protein